MEIKNRITMKSARIRAGLTEWEACKRIGIESWKLNLWEDGSNTPTAEEAVKMAETYMLPLDAISFSKEDNQIRFDHSELRARILKQYTSEEQFATAVKMKPERLNIKLEGKADFYSSEMQRIIEKLHLSSEEVNQCFFRTEDETLRKLSAMTSMMTDSELKVLRQIIETLDGRPDRRRYVLNYSGSMQDLPDALSRI